MNSSIFEHLGRAQSSVEELYYRSRRMYVSQNITKADCMDWFFHRQFSYQRLKSAILRSLRSFLFTDYERERNFDNGPGDMYIHQLSLFLESILLPMNRWVINKPMESSIIDLFREDVDIVSPLLDAGESFFALPYFVSPEEAAFDEDDLIQIQYVLRNRYFLRLFFHQAKQWNVQGASELEEYFRLAYLDQILKRLTGVPYSALRSYSNFMNNEYAFTWKLSSLKIPRDIERLRPEINQLVKSKLEPFDIVLEVDSANLPWTEQTYTGI